MVRDSGISATRPIFPSYLLPSFKFAFPRQPSSSSSSSSGNSPDSSAATTPANTPPDHSLINKSIHGRRLSRPAPDTLRCSTCSTDLAFVSQIISKGFTGRYGRAILVAPPAPPAEQTLLNIREGRRESRELATGWHVVADICCGTCSRKLGWKYVDATEQAQKYKVGKYILETERVVSHRHWDDQTALSDDIIDKTESASTRTSEDHEEIVFDSDNDDECEDMFAGTWDAVEVARRRSQTVARRGSLVP